MPSCVSSNGILIVIENVLFAEEIPQNLLQVKNLIQKAKRLHTLRKCRVRHKERSCHENVP